MTYSKREFAEDLKKQLESGYDPERIGSWAHEMYLDHCGDMTGELEEIITDLFVLEEGPEFELPFEDINKLVNKLKEEGEKEDLSCSETEIKDIAVDLGSYWLMCPLCEEAWENHSSLCKKYFFK